MAPPTSNTWVYIKFKNLTLPEQFNSSFEVIFKLFYFPDPQTSGQGWTYLTDESVYPTSTQPAQTDAQTYAQTDAKTDAKPTPTPSSTKNPTKVSKASREIVDLTVPVKNSSNQG